jgi:hypothetical protein
MFAIGTPGKSQICLAHIAAQTVVEEMKSVVNVLS